MPAAHLAKTIITAVTLLGVLLAAPACRLAPSNQIATPLPPDLTVVLLARRAFDAPDASETPAKRLPDTFFILEPDRTLRVARGRALDLKTFPLPTTQLTRRQFEVVAFQAEIILSGEAGSKRPVGPSPAQAPFNPTGPPPAVTPGFYDYTYSGRVSANGQSVDFTQTVNADLYTLHRVLARIAGLRDPAD